jgi:hypothetical protein
MLRSPTRSIALSICLTLAFAVDAAAQPGVASDSGPLQNQNHSCSGSPLPAPQEPEISYEFQCRKLRYSIGSYWYFHDPVPNPTDDGWKLCGYLPGPSEVHRWPGLLVYVIGTDSRFRPRSIAPEGVVLQNMTFRWIRKRSSSNSVDVFHCDSDGWRAPKFIPIRRGGPSISDLRHRRGPRDCSVGPDPSNTARRECPPDGKSVTVTTFR